LYDNTSCWIEGKKSLSETAPGPEWGLPIPYHVFRCTLKYHEKFFATFNNKFLTVLIP
jgi:hypothetical protein